MELRDYIRIIGQNFLVFIVVVLLSTGLAFIFSKTRPTTYTALETLTTVESSTLSPPNSADSIKAANLFSQEIQLWLGSPALVSEIYQKAGLAVPNISQTALGRTFKAARSEPSVLNVSTSGTDQAQLLQLINAADSVLETKVKASTISGQTSFYQLVKFNPIVTENEQNLLLNTIIGFIAGLILGILTALTVAYFKTKK